MAMPRYNAPGTRIDTGAGISQRATAQTLGTLTNVLDNWKQREFQEQKYQAIKEGETQAISDVSQGIVKYNEDAFSFFDQAYNDASLTAYTADANTKMKNMATQLSVEFQYDPEGYENAFNAYRKEVSKSAPHVRHRAIIDMAANTYGSQGYSKVLSQTQQKVYDNQAKSYAGYVEALTDDYLAAVQTKDIEGQEKALLNLQALQKSAVDNMIVSEGEVYAYNKNLVENGYVTQSMQEFYESEKPHEYLSAFIKNEHEYLTPESKQKTIDAMRNWISAENKLEADIVSADKREREETRRVAINGINNMMLSGTLTMSNLDLMLADEEITRSDYENYAKIVNNPGTQFDNKSTELSVSAYPMEWTKEDIITRPDLTWSTKQRLIKERASWLTSEGKWTNTINGSEARNRVKRHFGILSDTLMAKIDFTGKAAREFDQTYRKFFDRVQALPLEEREVKALEIADQVIAEYKESKAKEKVERDQQRKAEEEERIRAAEAAYKDSLVGKFMSTVGEFTQGGTSAFEE